MRKYIEPKIKAIKLDANQAILNICSVGAGYMNSSFTTPTCYTLSSGEGTSTNPCKTSARGKRSSVWITGGVYSSFCTPSSPPS